jgi:hypothetical protein
MKENIRFVAAVAPGPVSLLKKGLQIYTLFVIELENFFFIIIFSFALGYIHCIGGFTVTILNRLTLYVG